METGEKFGAEVDTATATAMKAIRDEAQARHADKAAKKAAFDSEYDVGEPLAPLPLTICPNDPASPAFERHSPHIWGIAGL
jgi:hypothetical protein